MSINFEMVENDHEIEDAKIAVELRQSLDNAVDYKVCQRFYKKYVLANVTDYADAKVKEMSIAAWANDFIMFGKFLEEMRKFSQQYEGTK